MTCKKTTRKQMEKLEKVEQKISEGKRNAAETQKIVMAKHEPSHFSRVFVWQIINFGEIRRQAKTGEIQKIDSASFYTESFGYKLIARIYPHGHGPSKNIHLSVYLVLMKGEYDAILRRPSKRK